MQKSARIALTARLINEEMSATETKDLSKFAMYAEIEFAHLDELTPAKTDFSFSF